MMNFYRENNLIEQGLLFGAYLVDYDNVMNYPECEVFDRDDKMHLLLLLSYMTRFIDTSSFNELITHNAIRYAYELLNEEKE